MNQDSLREGVESGLVVLSGKSPEGKLLPPYSITVLLHEARPDGTWKIVGLHEGRHIVATADFDRNQVSIVDVAQTVPEKKNELFPWCDPDPKDILAWVEGKG